MQKNYLTSRDCRFTIIIHLPRNSATNKSVCLSVCLYFCLSVYLVRLLTGKQEKEKNKVGVHVPWEKTKRYVDFGLKGHRSRSQAQKPQRHASEASHVITACSVTELILPTH